MTIVKDHLVEDITKLSSIVDGYPKDNKVFNRLIAQSLKVHENVIPPKCEW